MNLTLEKGEDGKAKDFRKQHLCFSSWNSSVADQREATALRWVREVSLAIESEFLHSRPSERG